MRRRSEAQKENVGRGEGKGARNGFDLCGTQPTPAAPNQNTNNVQNGDIEFIEIKFYVIIYIKRSLKTSNQVIMS